MHVCVDYSYEEDGHIVHVLCAESEQPIVLDKARVHFDVELPASAAERTYKFVLRAVGTIAATENVPVWNPVENKVLEGAPATMAALFKRSINAVALHARHLHPDAARAACLNDGNRVMVRNAETYFCAFVCASAADSAAFAPHQTGGVEHKNGVYDIAGRKLHIAGDVKAVEAYAGWTVDDFAAWYLGAGELQTRAGMFLHGKNVSKDENDHEFIDVPLLTAAGAPVKAVLHDGTEIKVFTRLYRYASIDDHKARHFLLDAVRRGLAASLFGAPGAIEDIVYKITAYNAVNVERQPGQTLTDAQFDAVWERQRSNSANEAEYALFDKLMGHIFKGHLAIKRSRSVLNEDAWAHVKSLYRYMYENLDLSEEHFEDAAGDLAKLVKYLEGLVNYLSNDAIPINHEDARQTIGMNDTVVRAMTKDHDPWHMLRRTEHGLCYSRVRPEGRMHVALFGANFPW
jgi:hypothetical protein